MASRRSSSSRNTPYPHARRASAPSVPVIAPLSPMFPVRPALRPSHSTTTGHDGVSHLLHLSHDSSMPSGIAASIPQPNILDSSQLETNASLPSSCPTFTLPSSISPLVKRETSPDLFPSNLTKSSLRNTGAFAGAASLPSLPMPTSYYLPGLAPNHVSPTNPYIEHWQVLSKEAAKRVDDLALLMALDQSTIVTFPPHTYTIVPGYEVGNNNWFRRQACTCDSYRFGFHKVRRPATIRDHLAKQVCAPASLSRLAEIQLRMMRATSKRHSHTSISESSEIRPMSVSSFHKQSSPSAWTRQPMQSMFGASSMPHLEAHMSQFSPTLGGSSDLHYQPATPYWTSFSHESTGVSQPQSTFEQNAQRALQQEWQPIDNNLEMSRSWRMSSHLGGMSSPFFGWSTDSEHAGSSVSMSTNSSNIANQADLSHTFSFADHLSQELASAKLDSASRPSSSRSRGHSFGLVQTSSAGALAGTAVPADPQLFAGTHNFIEGSDSPLFGLEESLFSFDDL